MILDGGGNVFDGHQYRHLRDRVGAWFECDYPDRVVRALELPAGEVDARTPPG